ncbi:MAG: VanZ family protein [Chitinophagales bacterium]
MEKHLKLHPYYASAAIVLFFSVGFVSLLPSQELPKTGFNHIDKLVHITMYFILSVILVKASLKLNNTPLKILAIPIVLSFFYSFGIEILQEMITDSRFFDIFDILANGIGCILALLLVKTPFFNKN